MKIAFALAYIAFGFIIHTVGTVMTPSQASNMSTGVLSSAAVEGENTIRVEAYPKIESDGSVTVYKAPIANVDMRLRILQEEDGVITPSAGKPLVVTAVDTPANVSMGMYHSVLTLNRNLPGSYPIGASVVTQERVNSAGASNFNEAIPAGATGLTLGKYTIPGTEWAANVIKFLFVDYPIFDQPDNAMIYHLRQVLGIINLAGVAYLSYVLFTGARGVFGL